MKWQRIALLCVLAVSALLHGYRLSYPSAPVFDEAHFATYAENYAIGEPYIDIHPPLGKVLYAIPLALSGGASADAPFMTTHFDQSTKQIVMRADIHPYGTMPYVPMRAVSVFFGLLLIVSVYGLLAAMTGNETTGLIAGVFIALDNALLLETRLVLLDGIYLSLAIGGLALLMKRGARPVLGGIVWGLAIGVKLIAGVLALPLCLLIVFHDATDRTIVPDRKTLIRFLITGVITFAAIALLMNNVLLPLNNRIVLYSQFFSREEYPTALVSPEKIAEIPTLIKAGLVTTMEMDMTLSGYTGGAAFHPSASPWYQWPFMWKSVIFFGTSMGAGFISLVGNPVVWGGAFALALIGIFLTARELMRHRESRTVPLMLVLWYLTALLPFALVGRVTFLYHYFPALLFSICIAAILIERFLARQPKSVRAICAVAGLLLLAFGFLLSSPYTYGFAL
jgi:dolichyl-phosphate-mannose-protein mannosyltransferase